MDKKIVSIIILEYFSLQDVKRCISSIRSSIETLPHEIIVSSNSCYSIDKQNKIINTFKDVKWLFNEKNGGFAYGMNKGLAEASGRYLLIINSDVIIQNGFRGMIEFMEANPGIGAIGPQMIDDFGLIQDTCRPYVTLPGFVSRQIRRLITREISVMTKNFNYSMIQTVDWLAGACIMIPYSVFSLTGGFSTDYFMYAEDMDLCTRIRQYGYEVVYYPKMQVIYKGSRQARKLNKFTRMFITSHLKYWMKFGFFSGYPKREDHEYE